MHYGLRAISRLAAGRLVTAGRVLQYGNHDSYTLTPWLIGYESDGSPGWSLFGPEGELAEDIVDLASGDGSRFVAMGTRTVPHTTRGFVVVTSYVPN